LHSRASKARIKPDAFRHRRRPSCCSHQGKGGGASARTHNKVVEHAAEGQDRRTAKPAPIGAMLCQR
jgi:hypothetical protein